MGEVPSCSPWTRSGGSGGSADGIIFEHFRCVLQYLRALTPLRCDVFVDCFMTAPSKFSKTSTVERISGLGGMRGSGSSEHWAYLIVETQDKCLVESQDICLRETLDMRGVQQHSRRGFFVPQK